MEGSRAFLDAAWAQDIVLFAVLVKTFDSALITATFAWISDHVVCFPLVCEFALVGLRCAANKG